MTTLEPPAAAAGLLGISVAVLLGLGSLMVTGPVPAAIPLLYLAAVSPELTRSDLFRRRLPNRMTLPGYPVAAIGLIASWLHSGDPPVLALVSGLSYFAFLAVLAVAGGMGTGDVKLAGLMGMAAGLLGPLEAVLSPVLAFTLGGLVSAVMLARGRRHATIPFGPFMLAGFWAAVAAGAVLG